MFSGTIYTISQVWSGTRFGSEMDAGSNPVSYTKENIMVDGWIALGLISFELLLYYFWVKLLISINNLYSKPKPKKKSKEIIIFKRSDNYPLD